MSYPAEIEETSRRQFSAGKFRVLHVGNIVNNGYSNAKFLREAGFHNDVISYDYFHAQGMPEWEDADFDEAVAEWSPDWSKVCLNGFVRPDWFFGVRMEDIPDLEPAGSSYRPLPSVPDGKSKRIRARAKGMITAILPEFSKRKISSVYRLWRDRMKLGIHQPGQSVPIPSGLVESLKKDFRNFYPDAVRALSDEDFDYCRYKIPFFRPFFRKYDLIQAYSLDPIHAMIAAPEIPFIAFEHGTMRDFPFQDDARGRLYALSLKKAKAVLITNADNIRSAKRLNLENYRFIPHPVDDKVVKPASGPLRGELLAKYKAEFIFLAPARHHWKNCPPGMENSWFKKNDIMIRALANLFHKDKVNAVVLFCEWGQEVNESKKLIRECGIEDRVVWLPLLPKRKLVQYYSAADVVLDQFNGGIGTFGTTAPEGMACEKPVILNWNPDLHTWCWPEQPPLLRAENEEEIIGHLRELTRNPEYRKEVGRRGREWFLKYHTREVVTRTLLRVHEEALKDKK